MSRSEHWNTSHEIKRNFQVTTNPNCGAGPVVYVENGIKYSDDTEKHIAVIGCTGKGKSQCCTLPLIRESLLKGESMIIVDPKGECYRQNACYIPPEYQRFCVDFRHPRKSPTKWNPLSSPLRLFKSPDPDDHDIASSMLSELWAGVYPWDGHSDRFWIDASINYAKGLTYGLFETAPEDQINLDSVAVMMEQSEIRFAAGTVLKSFYESLPNQSLAKRNLASYVTAPNDTRASIHSVAASGLEVFSRSRGLMELLGEDTLNIMDIDVTRPFFLVIITPDETDCYDALAALLINQVTQHLIRVAQDMGGRLPVRVNCILEELGSIGRGITALPNLMVASRSRNIRLMLVLQSYAQLFDVYGKSKAETIISCIGITFGFSTNSWDTLNEWSQRCGQKQVMHGDRMITEPLITASQLAAMPTGTCLVMVDNRYKFISHLPFYNDMYDNSNWTPPAFQKFTQPDRMKTIDFEEFVKAQRKSKLEAMLSQSTPEPSQMFSHNETRSMNPSGMEALMAQIEKRLAELDAEFEAEEKKKPYCVLVKKGNTAAVAKAVASCSSKSEEEAADRLEKLPAALYFDSKEEAEKVAEAIRKAKGHATVKKNDT